MWMGVWMEGLLNKLTLKEQLWSRKKKTKGEGGEKTHEFPGFFEGLSKLFRFC